MARFSRYAGQYGDKFSLQRRVAAKKWHIQLYPVLAGYSWIQWIQLDIWLDTAGYGQEVTRQLSGT